MADHHREAKAAGERETVRLLLEDLDEIPDRPLESEPDDPPDVWLWLRGRRIGVEVTRFFSNDRPDGSERLKDIVPRWNSLVSRFEETPAPWGESLRVGLHVCFSDRLRVPKGQRHHKAFIDETLRLALGGCPQPAPRRTPLKVPASGYPELTRCEVEEVVVCGIAARPARLSVDWNGECGPIGLSEAELRATLKEKFEKDYPKADALWLLVTAGHSFAETMGIDEPSAEELNEFTDVTELLQNGPFDRVFLHQRPWARLLDWTPAKGWALLKDRPR